jgi:hypothetical protein
MDNSVTAAIDRNFDSANPGCELATNAIIEIVFPGASQLRSREVVKRSNARPTGKYPSWKMGRMLQWESKNELNAFRLLDCDPEVAHFNEQPCEIVYVANGVSRSHFPDILVQTNGRKELWEVKPESKAEEPEIASRTALLTASLPFWGYSYRVALAKDLAAQPRQSNAFFLLGFGWYQVKNSEREFIRREINQNGSLLWADACSGRLGTRGREILCGLVLRGVLAIEMGSPITPDTHFFARRKGA